MKCSFEPLNRFGGICKAEVTTRSVVTASLTNSRCNTVEAAIDLFCLLLGLSSFINSAPHPPISSTLTAVFPPVRSCHWRLFSHQGQPHSASQYINNGGDSFSLLSRASFALVMIHLEDVLCVVCNNSLGDPTISVPFYCIC